MTDRQPSKVENKIREWRLYRDLSLQQLSALVGYDQRAIARWERRAQTITIDQMQDIATALDCTICDLLYWDPKKKAAFQSQWTQLSPQRKELLMQIIEPAAATRKPGATGKSGPGFFEEPAPFVM